MFRRLAGTMGRPELPEDPRFNSNAQRIAHRAETDALVQEWVGSHTAEEAIRILDENEVPVTLVYSVADMFEDPQYAARENIISVEDPTDGEIKMSNVVPRLSLTPGRVDWSGPEMGVHNEEVYGDLLGYSQEEVARMKQEGII
jgi:crotonobetainyl-CoA:carnitine CoA-transferase CaiB-like acyl-CoA transferase